MKKLWTKFKHWLIRKLGGYVQPEKTCVVHHYTVTPITVESVLTGIRYDEYHNNPRYKDYVDKLLIDKLVDYLHEYQASIVDIFESSPTYSGPLMETTMDLRASVKVCPKAHD